MPNSVQTAFDANKPTSRDLAILELLAVVFVSKPNINAVSSDFITDKLKWLEISSEEVIQRLNKLCELKFVEYEERGYVYWYITNTGAELMYSYSGGARLYKEVSCKWQEMNGSES